MIEYYAPARSRLIIGNARWANRACPWSIYLVGQNEEEQLVTSGILDYRRSMVIDDLLDHKFEDGMVIVRSEADAHPLTVQWYRGTACGNWCSGAAVDRLEKGLHAGHWVCGPDWRTEVLVVVDRRADSDGVPSNRSRQFFTNEGGAINYPTFYPEDGGITVFHSESLGLPTYPGAQDVEGTVMVDHEWAPGAGWCVNVHKDHGVATHAMQWAGENQEWEER